MELFKGKTALISWEVFSDFTFILPLKTENDNFIGIIFGKKEESYKTQHNGEPTLLVHCLY